MFQFYSLSLVEFHNVPVLYFISFVATPLWSLAESDLAACSMYFPCILVLVLVDSCFCIACSGIVKQNKFKLMCKEILMKERDLVVEKSDSHLDIYYKK